MSKQRRGKGLPLSARIPRKAIPIGCNSAWWYAETNGDLTLYGHSYDGKPFSATIKARALKVIRRVPADTRKSRE